MWARFPVKGIQQFCTRFSYFYIYAFLLNRCATNTMLSHAAIVSIRFPPRESLVSSASADASSVPFRLDSYIYVYKGSDPQHMNHTSHTSHTSHVHTRIIHLPARVILQFATRRFKGWVGKRKIGFWANLSIGYIASLINTVILSPLETLATRVMAASQPTTILATAHEVRDVVH